MKHSLNIDRRQLLRAMLGSSFVLMTPGCGPPALPAAGELLAPNHDFGHRLRDGFRPTVGPDDWQEVGCLIVGGGIAGLSAGWKLKKLGYDDFEIFELESEAGGTALSGERDGFAYPWGAHYVPVPMAENQELIRLFDEMGVLESKADDGPPIVKEQFLCRDPEERLFIDGEWIKGIYPAKGATDDDLRQLREFRDEVDHWVDRRDADGRRMFAIPMVAGSVDEEVRRLDSITMAAWLDQHGWDSKRLRWIVDYACRDDYGLRLEQTSAWAGLFYFAARIKNSGDESQAVVTWPRGNGQIVKYLREQVGENLKTGHAVCGIRQNPAGGVEVIAFDLEANKPVGVRCQHLIFAAPQFLAAHLIDGFDEERSASEFQYGSWMVANVHLRNRPENVGFASSWDNVIYDSPSLGYVVSTHQTGNDHGPSVFTWYYPFTAADPALSRKQLLDLGWSHWADIVLSDLERAHPDIRELATRVDVMRWGHAMVQPRPGFVWSDQRQSASAPMGSIHFANTDLSGIALFEEAFYHGVRAAQEVADTA